MSLVLSTDTIVKKIEKHKYRYAKIFEGFVTPNDDDNKHHFDKFECSSYDVLADEIKEFAKSYHGKFTIVMRVNKGGNDATLTACRWDTTPEAKPIQNAGAMNGGALTHADLDKYKQQWLQEMSVMLKVKELEAQLLVKDSELNGFKSQGDKLAYVALQVLNGVAVNKKLNLGTNLNGASGDNMQQPEQIPIQNVEAFKAAIHKLHWLLGEETLLKLAAKINPGEEMIGMVKMYANS